MVGFQGMERPAMTTYTPDPSLVILLHPLDVSMSIITHNCGVLGHWWRLGANGRPGLVSHSARTLKNPLELRLVKIAVID